MVTQLCMYTPGVLADAGTAAVTAPAAPSSAAMAMSAAEILRLMMTPVATKGAYLVTVRRNPRRDKMLTAC